jgi:hypothetical protein
MSGSPKRVTVEAKGHIAVSGCVTGPGVVVVIVEIGDVNAGPHWRPTVIPNAPATTVALRTMTTTFLLTLPELPVIFANH